MTLLFAWLARWVDAVAAAAVQRALVPITQEQERMSQTLTALSTVVTGLTADLAAAQSRVQIHDAATDKAISDLNAKIAALQATPGDTSADEAALAAIVADLQAARAQAQAIEPDAPAPVATDAPAAA